MLSVTSRIHVYHVLNVTHFTFEELPFTTLASSVNGKTSKKACKNDAAVLGVSRPLRPRHTKKCRVVFLCFSLKFYRLRRKRRRYTVKYQRKACKNDAAVLGVSRP